MEALNVSETRKNLSKILLEGKPVEVKHPKTSAVILPKVAWEKKEQRIKDLEIELLMKEMDLAEARHEKKYTTEEVEAMLQEVTGGALCVGSVSRAIFLQKLRDKLPLN